MPAPTNPTTTKPAATSSLSRSPRAPVLHATVPFARLLAATTGSRKLGLPTPPTAKPGSAPPHHRHRDRDDRDRERGSDVDPLDPATRRLAQLAPPRIEATAPAPIATAEPAGEIAPRARVSIEELLPQLVRRIAWAGDRRRGSVQLELGAGRHAGTVVTVHAENGRVRIDVQGSDELRARIGERLARHGLDVES